MVRIFTTQAYNNCLKIEYLKTELSICAIAEKSAQNDPPWLRYRSILRIKTSIVIIVPAVSFNFAMINDKPSLRLQFLNIPSTVFRSPTSLRSVRISSA